MSTWRYNRMYRNRAATPVQKVEDATIPTRIDTLLNNGLVNTWEQNFLGSVKAGYEKYKSLTQGQYNTLVGIEARYDSKVIAAREVWKTAWDSEKANNWSAMCEYYATTPYYKGAVDKYRADKNYIPSENEYRAVVENKYAQRYLKNRDIPAKFKQGALVVYKKWGTYKLATVVSVREVADWTKGSREYEILEIGEASANIVQEKTLLYYREGLISKIDKPDNDIPF